jgi:hypothetical protein
LLKLGEWKSAITAASEGLEGLEREFGFEKAEKDGEEAGGGVVELEDEGDVGEDGDDNGGRVSGEKKEKDALRRLEEKDERRRDGERIRAKCLMRRARGRMEVGGWGELSAAEEGMVFISCCIWFTVYVCCA